MQTHQGGLFDGFLNTVHNAISVASWHEPRSAIYVIVGIREERVGLWNRGLIGYRKHAHPAAQDAKAVNCVKRLGPTLNHGQA